MGAGAGNCPLEVFVAVADLMGWKHGCDLFALQDAADDARPSAAGPAGAGRPGDADARVRGRLLAASCCTPSGRRSGTDVDVRDILVELGRRRMVGGQEDMIVDVALDLAGEKA